MSPDGLNITYNYKFNILKTQKWVREIFMLPVFAFHLSVSPPAQSSRQLYLLVSI